MSTHGAPIPTPILQHGPMLDVVIGPASGPLAGIKARGLIDTGADGVLISHSIAKHLQLRHLGDEILAAVGGHELGGKLHSGRIQVPHLGFDKVLPLYAVNWDQTSHTVLLGRSFLQYFVFHYDGPSNVFSFSNPIFS